MITRKYYNNNSKNNQNVWLYVLSACGRECLSLKPSKKYDLKTHSDVTRVVVVVHEGPLAVEDVLHQVSVPNKPGLVGLLQESQVGDLLMVYFCVWLYIFVSVDTTYMYMYTGLTFPDI